MYSIRLIFSNSAVVIILYDVANEKVPGADDNLSSVSSAAFFPTGSYTVKQDLMLTMSYSLPAAITVLSCWEFKGTSPFTEKNDPVPPSLQYHHLDESVFHHTSDLPSPPNIPTSLLFTPLHRWYVASALPFFHPSQSSDMMLSEIVAHLLAVILYCHEVTGWESEVR